MIKKTTTKKQKQNSQIGYFTVAQSGEKEKSLLNTLNTAELYT